MPLVARPLCFPPTWQSASSSTASRCPRAALVKSLALVDPPPPIPAGIDVRMISTYEDFTAAREIQWEAFDTPEDRRASAARVSARRVRRVDGSGIPVGFLASLDGEPAATGLAVRRSAASS